MAAAAAVEVITDFNFVSFIFSPCCRFGLICWAVWPACFFAVECGAGIGARAISRKNLANKAGRAAQNWGFLQSRNLVSEKSNKWLGGALWFCRLWSRGATGLGKGANDKPFETQHAVAGGLFAGGAHWLYSKDGGGKRVVPQHRLTASAQFARQSWRRTAGPFQTPHAANVRWGDLCPLC